MNYTNIERCRGCHAPSGRMEPVLSMDPMPLAGMFCVTDAEAKAAPVFPLTWLHCANCGLVQVREDVSDDSLFAKYNYSSSTVPGLVRHFVGYAEFLASRYGKEQKISFLEIGCNDGVLLTKLPSAWRLAGWDPSDVAERAAKENRQYQLTPQPFALSTVAAARIAESVDVISGSNCLAHISELRDVFEAARHALRPGGHLWIEVHDLHALLKGAQWDTIYHEHKVEWSEASLIRCLTPLGFAHKETILTPMHGGALRICFEKGAGNSQPAGTAAPEAGLSALRDAYQRRYETAAAQRLQARQASGERIAAYGAAGRANVYLNQLPQLRFDYIVDESPLRMNKFIPRVAAPILPPRALEEKPAASCLITAWNYRDDIVRKNAQHRGEWLTAFEA